MKYCRYCHDKSFPEDYEYCPYCACELITEEEYKEKLREEKEAEERAKVRAKLRAEESKILRDLLPLRQKYQGTYIFSYHTLDELKEIAEITFYHKTTTRKKLYDELYSMYKKIDDNYKLALPIYQKNLKFYRFYEQFSLFFVQGLKAYLHGGVFSVIAGEETEFVGSVPFTRTKYRKFEITKGVDKRIVDDVLKGGDEFGIYYIFIKRELENIMRDLGDIVGRVSRGTTCQVINFNDFSNYGVFKNYVKLKPNY